MMKEIHYSSILTGAVHSHVHCPTKRPLTKVIFFPPGKEICQQCDKEKGECSEVYSLILFQESLSTAKDLLRTA